MSSETGHLVVPHSSFIISHSSFPECQPWMSTEPDFTFFAAKLTAALREPGQTSGWADVAWDAAPTPDPAVAAGHLPAWPA